MAWWLRADSSQEVAAGCCASSRPPPCCSRELCSWRSSRFAHSAQNRSLEAGEEKQAVRTAFLFHSSFPLTQVTPCSAWRSKGRGHISIGGHLWYQGLTWSTCRKWSPFPYPVTQWLVPWLSPSPFHCRQTAEVSVASRVHGQQKDLVP